MKPSLVKHRGELTASERRAVSKIHLLLEQPGLLRASLVYMRRKCGRDYCKCMRSPRQRHGSWYIAQSYKGKKRMLHVNPGHQTRVRQWVDRYHEIKRTLNMVADLYWDRLKKKA